MKFIEFGYGNKWILRTEVENTKGEEYEVKGILGPIKFHSLYLRIWLKRRVYILDTKDGLKKELKNRDSFKFLLGIVSK